MSNSTRISLTSPTPSKKRSLLWSDYEKNKSLQEQRVVKPQKLKSVTKGNAKRGKNV